MKKWWQYHRPQLVGWLIYAVARAVGMTLRFRVVGNEHFYEGSGGKIFLMWHGRTFVLGQFYRNKGVWVMISHSRDGEIQNHIFRKLGFNIIRGSTGRGGERALIESIRCLREGNRMAITPDGPRGPANVIQQGVMVMARKSGASFVPVGASARPRILFRSWDRHMIALPFARVEIRMGAPMKMDDDADEGAVEDFRLRLQEEMNRLQNEAERACGYEPIVPAPAQEAAP